MKNNIIAPLVFFSIISVIYALPILSNISYWGHMDWDQFTFWNAVPRETIFKYHQIPLWNPYSNGGNVLLAHPQSPILSPLYVFVLIFGPIVGLKLEIIVHLIIGLWGMFVLAKHLKLCNSPAFLTSFVYMLNSMYVLHLTEGHTEWFAMAFVPLVFLYYLKSLEMPKYILGAIVFLGLILLNGSIDVFTVIIAMLSVFAILKIIQVKRIAPVKLLIVLFAGTFLLCSVKLIPLIEFLTQTPRLTGEYGGTSLRMLFTLLLSKNQVFLNSLNWDEALKLGLNFEWHEYGAYIGIIPFGLFIYGAIKTIKKEWPLLLTGSIFLLIALGDKSPVNVWGLLHLFPIYDSLTVPSRFILGFVFCASILSGFGFSCLLSLSSKIDIVNKYIKPNVLSTAIVLFVLFDLWQVNSPIFKNAFRIPPFKITANETFTQRYRYINYFEENNLINFVGEETSYSSMYPIFLSNSGILEAYEVMNVKKGDVRTLTEKNYRGEIYLESSNGDISLKKFSPNMIVANVKLIKPDILIINQNYYIGWIVKIDGTIKPAVRYNGLISTPIEAGSHEIVFYFMPLSFLIGLCITVCFMLFSTLFYIRKVGNQ